MNAEQFAKWAEENELPNVANPADGMNHVRKHGKRALPMVVLPSGAVTITESAQQLFEIIASTHRLFVRGKVVVSLQRTITGQLVLEPLRPSAARSFFEHFAYVVVWRSGRRNEDVLKPTVIPEETARALLDCHVAATVLPRVNGLVNCPVITEAGGVLTVCEQGYSAETGLLIQNGEKPQDVKFLEALMALRTVLADFAFQTPSDESRAMASIITPALKMGNLIRGFVPVDIAEADQSQSGKTYRQKMVAAVYGETPALVPLKRGGVGSTDESLYEKLVNGRPFIQFDNYRGSLDSPALEAFLTSEGSFPCRIAGCREIEVDPSRFFIHLTSNGVETTRDLANRASIVRIRKRSPMTFPDTLGRIQARQGYFIGCVFALIRRWHQAGKPHTSETRHDFREWCQTLDWIVQHLCRLPPLMDGHLAAQERVSDPALTFLRRIALEVERTGNLGLSLMASQIYELADAADVQVPGLRKEDSHDESKAARIIGVRLAPVFKDRQTVELDGFVVARSSEARCRTDGNGNYSAKTYTFNRLAQQPQQPQQGE